METLKDPCNDRQVPSVELPPILPLSDAMLWTQKDVPDWELVRDHLKKEGKITKEHVMKMGELVLDIAKKESTLVYLDEPVWIVGDIHGQYYDLVHLLEKAGKPK